MHRRVFSAARMAHHPNILLCFVEQRYGCVCFASDIMSLFTPTVLAMCAGTAAAAGYVLYRAARLRRPTPYGETGCQHYGHSAHVRCLFELSNARRGLPAWPGLSTPACCLAAAGNQAPQPRHLALPASVTRNRRVVIIGDVHGCADELTTLLDAITRPTDLVLFVGDLVNKGSKSPEVSWGGGFAVVRKAAGRGWNAGQGPSLV